MKTVQSSSAPKANMRSNRNNKIVTPNSDRKNEKEQTSGKKLVQARLPFKILPGTPTSIPQEGVNSSSTVDVPSKKRRLSYTEEPENPKKIAKDIIVLSDEDTPDESKIGKSPKTPALVASQNKDNKNTPRSAGGTVTTPKLQIKLPLSGKKKRKTKRASRSAKNEESDESDADLVSDDQRNPQKKVKLDNQSGQSNEETLVDEPLNLDVETDKTKQDKTSTVEKVEKETEPQTPKTSKQKTSPIKYEKTNKPVESEIEADKNKLKETNSPKTQNKEKQVRKSEKNEKNEIKSESKFSTPSKKDMALSATENEKTKSSADDSKSDIITKELTESRDEKSSRRSTKMNVVENITDEVDLTSEPDRTKEKTNAADISISNEPHNKMLTPKQLKLQEQRRKAREEKELKLQQVKEERERKLQEQREERERKLQEEKMQKQKEREERELQRKKEREEKEDQKRREKEEKEEQRRKEKEDKERKRLAEMEVKNEEKRKKDELKEEERRKKEEEDNKKKKAAQAFTKFFVPKTVKPTPDEDQDSRDDAESVDSLAFRPFQVKGDMKMAPLVRQDFNSDKREKLDSFLKSSQTNESCLYIDELRNGSHIPLRGSKTVLKVNDDNDDDVVIIETELENAAQTIDEPRTIPIQTYKAKYYLFRENRRPPFYGTWRKKSTVITPRRPFALDKTFFDYEVDSDDEWEEEEPGESLNGSEDEKESEDEDYEVDNEWFVPHGHLSDEEMQNEDELGPDTSREAQKAKLKALQQEFAQEMKKKTKKIKPRLIGAIWEDENGNRPDLCPSVIWESLCAGAMMFCEQVIIEEPEVIQPDPPSPPPEKQKRIDINEELMGDLVRLVHGNRHSRDFLIKEYLEHLSSKCETIKSGECLAPTKSQMKEKIYEISKWSVVNAANKKNKNKKKLCWVVRSDILDKYSLGNLGLRNEWCYKLQPKFEKDKKDENEVKEVENNTTNTESNVDDKSSKNLKKKPKSSAITKFARVLTHEEKQNQLSVLKKSASVSSVSPKSKTIKKSSSPSKEKILPPSSNTQNKQPLVKKRVALLMSVAPGQEFSQKSKNALISQFLQKSKIGKSALPSPENKTSDFSASSATQMDVDEVVVLE